MLPAFVILCSLSPCLLLQLLVPLPFAADAAYTHHNRHYKVLARRMVVRRVIITVQIMIMMLTVAAAVGTELRTANQY